MTLVGSQLRKTGALRTFQLTTTQLTTFNFLPNKARVFIAKHRLSTKPMTVSWIPQ